ncbi:hypothetical protein HDU92_000565 [Lobulomyces angularis]|nr:hypothetical protein HDU92_000565 [Lobulomyces angularis]
MRKCSFVNHEPLENLIKNENLRGEIFSLTNSDFTKRIIKKADISKIPSLKHDLQRFVNSEEKFYSLKESKLNIEITQPRNFYYNRLSPYKKPHQDKILQTEAKNADVKYFSSTSSITNLLVKMYSLINPRKNVFYISKSAEFSDEPQRFTNIIRKPTSSIVHWKSSTLKGIDIERAAGIGVEPPTILLKMGRSLEKMLVLESDDYNYFVKDKSLPQKEGMFMDDGNYNYTKMCDFLFRSQIDCKIASCNLKKNMIFDIKSRAVFPIRMDVQNYEKYLEYKFNNVHGIFYSWEREYFDMLRSVFIKWNFQGKLGLMDGMFVIYHTTKDALGFQYISLDTINKHLCGSVEFGDYLFKSAVQLLNKVMNYLVKRYPEKNLRLTLDLSEVQQLTILVENIPITESFVHGETKNTVNEISVFKVFARLKHNSSGLSLTQEMIEFLQQNYNLEKSLTVDYSIIEVTDRSKENIANIWSSTRRMCSNLTTGNVIGKDLSKILRQFANRTSYTPSTENCSDQSLKSVFPHGFTQEHFEDNSQNSKIMSNKIADILADKKALVVKKKEISLQPQLSLQSKFSNNPLILRKPGEVAIDSSLFRTSTSSSQKSVVNNIWDLSEDLTKRENAKNFKVLRNEDKQLRDVNYIMKILRKDGILIQKTPLEKTLEKKN